MSRRWGRDDAGDTSFTEVDVRDGPTISNWMCGLDPSNALTDRANALIRCAFGNLLWQAWARPGVHHPMSTLERRLSTGRVVLALFIALCVAVVLLYADVVVFQLLLMASWSMG